jgi:alkylation response protein AidB-like acyl-CoA dehydrogenase
VIDEELRRAGVGRPENPIGIGWAGPTLVLAGTGEQQRRWLPGLLDGSEVWCQLFSEPGAGSDLASLSTRAERDGDEWVVSGQKIWTSLARDARYGILLARTDPDAPRHRGISYFVLDMRLPGIDIRPIKQMDGGATFNEVFLDGVRLPAGNLIGDEGDGWRLAKVTLGNERVALSEEGALWGRGPTVQALVKAVKKAGRPLDPVSRQRLAAIYSEAEVLRILRLRMVADLLGRPEGSSREPGPEASVRKALADRHGQKLFDLAVDLCGADGMLSRENPPQLPGLFPWVIGFLFSPALTIGGGTAEVQRNIIAERVLGLPRDPAA